MLCYKSIEEFAVHSSKFIVIGKNLLCTKRMFKDVHGSIFEKVQTESRARLDNLV